MTRIEREEVVELLRCAADKQESIGVIATGEGPPYDSTPVMNKAVRAWHKVYVTGDLEDREVYRWSCLEAAQRVEDGV